MAGRIATLSWPGSTGCFYGDDPAQGIIDGSRFIHPDLRLSFQRAPGLFYMVNGTRAVSISGTGRSGPKMMLAPYAGNLDTYVRQQFAALGGEGRNLAPATNAGAPRSNGLPAVVGEARVNNGNSQVDVVVFAYEFARDRAFHFTAIAPAGRAGVFNPMFQSNEPDHTG